MNAGRTSLHRSAIPYRSRLAMFARPCAQCRPGLLGSWHDRVMPDASTWWGADEGFEAVVQISFDVDGRTWRGDHFPSHGAREGSAFPDLSSAMAWAVGLDARFELIDPLDHDVHGWPSPEMLAELQRRAARALQPPDPRLKARRLPLDH